VTHPRPADLWIGLHVVDYNNIITQTIPLFDGPKTADALSPADADKLQLPDSIDIPMAQLSGDCHHFRINVADMRPGNVGTFNKWELDRRSAVNPIAHDNPYYRQLLFGDRYPNLVGYHHEVSRWQFTWTPAGDGVIGPLDYDRWTTATDDSTHVLDVLQLLERNGFDFRPYDVNGDNIVRNDELAIVAFDNGERSGGGANRHYGDQTHDCAPLRNGMKYCGNIVFVPEEVDFATLAHEMSHQLGTDDLYGDWGRECLSQGLTLMSCPLDGLPDSAQTVYLDPWHRVKLGWLDPITPNGNSIQLGDENFYSSPKGPAIFQREGDSTEYYLLEYRDRSRYDANVGDDGMVAWHVKEDANGNQWLGADGKDNAGHAIYAVGPDALKGATQAWKSSDGPFRLHWLDGRPLPLSFRVKDIDQPYAAELDWQEAPEDDTGPSIDIVQPIDGSSGPLSLAKAVVLQAKVADARGSTEGLTISWSSDVDGALGTGATANAYFTRPGKRTITVTARDQYGSSSTKSVQYTVTNNGPWVRIDAPFAGHVLYRKQPVRLLGAAGTAAILGLPCDQLHWSSPSLTFWTRTECQVEANVPSFNLTGDVVFKLTARDEFGVTASKTVKVAFVDPPAGSPPIVSITSPSPRELMESTHTYTISGVVSDPAGGPVSYRWAIYDNSTLQETVLPDTTPSFTWQPDSLITGNTKIEIRLYGKSDQGLTIATQEMSVVPSF
jgi:M6 family metalloprotease-like protein